MDKNSERLVSTTVYLTKRELDSLKLVKTKIGMPMSVFIRRAIDKDLNLFFAELYKKKAGKKTIKE